MPCDITSRHSCEASRPACSVYYWYIICAFCILWIVSLKKLEDYFSNKCFGIQQSFVSFVFNNLYITNKNKQGWLQSVFYCTSDTLQHKHIVAVPYCIHDSLEVTHVIWNKWVPICCQLNATMLRVSLSFSLFFAVAVNQTQVDYLLGNYANHCTSNTAWNICSPNTWYSQLAS